MECLIVLNIIRIIFGFIVFIGMYNITNSFTDGLLAVVITLLYAILEELDCKDLKSRGMIK